jgi:ABC-type Fe3+ transport system permease subunit
MQTFKKSALTAAIGVALFFSAMAPSITLADKIEERPTATQMAADAFLMRPLMLGGTVLGAGIYIVSLPISLLGGNAEEAGKKLVVHPFKATFMRCLGCTKKHAPDEEYY